MMIIMVLFIKILIVNRKKLSVWIAHMIYYDIYYDDYY